MSEYDAEPLPEPEPVSNEVEANEVEANEVEANEVEEEPAPVEEEEPAPANEEEEGPVSTQDVVQNVQEMLTTETFARNEVSTETVDNSKVNELEERVKVLEERLKKLIGILHQRSWRNDLNQV